MRATPALVLRRAARRRRVVTRLGAVVVVASALVGLPTVLAASPAASATHCGALVVTPRPEASPPSLQVVVPSALTGQAISKRSWSVDQQGRVPVAAARPLPPSKLDVAVVLDTAADSPGVVYRRARSVVTALLTSLPAAVRVTVISAGGEAAVLTPLGTDRAEAVDRVRSAPRGPGHAWLDAIVRASRALPDRPARFAQVVVVTTGPDDASAREADGVRTALENRAVALSVTSAGPRRTPLPWGDRCPPRVVGDDGPLAGQLLARRVAGQYVLVAPHADLTEPVTVRVRSAAVDTTSSTAFEAGPTKAPATASGTKVLGTKIGRLPSGGHGPPWVLIGFGVLAAVLVATMAVVVLTSRGEPMLAGVGAPPPRVAPVRADAAVLLVEPEPSWPATAAALVADIAAALGDRALLLEHVGSTSVPGLFAKPVLDLVLAVRDPADEAAYLGDLERIGFELRVREPDWQEHRLLKREAPEVNLHVFGLGSLEIDRLLAFRDQLRADPDDRALYEHTKRDLAEHPGVTVQQYAGAKSAVIEEIVARALRVAPGPVTGVYLLAGPGPDGRATRSVSALARRLGLPLLSLDAVARAAAAAGPALSPGAAAAVVLAVAAAAPAAVVVAELDRATVRAALPGRLVDVTDLPGWGDDPDLTVRAVRQLARPVPSRDSSDGGG